MTFPPRAGRVSGRATPSLCHAPRAKLQRTNPGSSPLSLRGILFRRSEPALPFVCWIQRWAARHRPRLEHTIQFKTQVVVQTSRRMLLNDKTAPTCGNDQSFASWLSRFGEVPLPPIARKLFACRHGLYLFEFERRIGPTRAGSRSDPLCPVNVAGSANGRLLKQPPVAGSEPVTPEGGTC